MLSGNHTVVPTFAAMGAPLAVLWVVAVGAFAYGVTGRVSGWPAGRVKVATLAGATLAVVLSPIFALFGWAVVRGAFVELALDPGQNFWLVVAGIGMPSALLVAIVGSRPVLKAVRESDGKQVSRTGEGSIWARETLRGGWTTLMALGLCAQFVAYVGSYAAMSAGGQYWRVGDRSLRNESFVWIPEGFATGQSKEELNHFLHAVYLPLWYLDNEFVHPGDKVFRGYRPPCWSAKRIRL